MLVKHDNRYTWFGKEISEEKYEKILAMLRNRPAAPVGYAYRLTENLMWELYELPAVEDAEAESDT